VGKAETLARWKALAGDASERAWEDEDLDFFLHRFRPLGRDLEQVFEGVKLGAEVLPRLQELYEATAEGYGEGGEDEPVFVVRRPKLLTERRVLELGLQHVQRMGQVGQRVKQEDVARLAIHVPEIEIQRGETAPDADELPEFEGQVLAACADLLGALEPMESEALLLRDSLYYLGNDYLLGYYILWPLYLHETDLNEPFQPYFELWIHGAQARFESAEKLSLYVPDTL
jgi:hypothetical protein